MSSPSTPQEDAGRPRAQADRVLYSCENCKKGYVHSGSLDNHQRKCYTTKRGFSALLEQTKIHWEAKKKRRLEIQTATSQPIEGGAMAWLFVKGLDLRHYLDASDRMTSRKRLPAVGLKLQLRRK
ncbi:hypothetical protein DFP72DRAFT_843033 [Ephemerocybe angulata]|uniref:C2H2-type domain-containing protein n=1 Tax=Ephemerocybe angulata TaxID=980116 RepID=A0A8H6MCE9_9AGAR|nr:hypothetical protein DFP72DRAFT_843033 [Tulosesus angulatus]